MAEAIAALVRAVRLRDGLRHIYVVGHDFGALVGWRVAQLLTRDELAGLVSFEPHPELLSRVPRLEETPLPSNDVPPPHMAPMANIPELCTAHLCRSQALKIHRFGLQRLKSSALPEQSRALEA